MSEEAPARPRDVGKPAALELDQVRKVYAGEPFKKRHVAVDGLTCRFEAGTCTGLLGHNGAGKTTTIRLILGLIRPDSGRILFEGALLTTATKRFIGYMPEVNKLSGALTPLEILHRTLKLYAPEHIRTRAQRREAVDRKLIEVGLDGHRKKRVAQLSKGMARRLAWAQATIHAPRLLILDEPASGLDPLGRRHMLGWIEQEKQRGAGILLCTHELQQVATLCDDIHVLRRGCLVKTQAACGKDAAGDKPRYGLAVSGLDEPTLLALAQNGSLPEWQGYRREGFLTELEFAAYQDGVRWLGAVIARGLVVVRFGEVGRVREEELLSYFEGES